MSHLRPTKSTPAAAPLALTFLTPSRGRRRFAPRHWSSGWWLLLLRVSALLPLRVSRGLGAAIGWLMMANAKRRRIAHINLALCFPQRSRRERARLLRRHFIVSGQAYLDIGFLTWASERRILRKLRLRGLEHYHEHLAKKNIILLAPHCVGMNFGGSVIAREHAQFSMVKLQGNPAVNWLLNRARMRFGCRLLARQQGLRPVIRGLKQRLAFYYLPDEDFGLRQSVFVPFFGVPTATLATLGRLAKLTDAVVIPCFTRLLPGGRGYEVIFKPALKDFPSGDRVRDAARMNAAMEEGIRSMPEQYLWTFKIFKTRPDRAASPYG